MKLIKLFKELLAEVIEELKQEEIFRLKRKGHDLQEAQFENEKLSKALNEIKDILARPANIFDTGKILTSISHVVEEALK